MNGVVMLKIYIINSCNKIQIQMVVKNLKKHNQHQYMEINLETKANRNKMIKKNTKTKVDNFYKKLSKKIKYNHYKIQVIKIIIIYQNNRNN